MIVQLNESGYEIISINASEGYTLLYDTETGRKEIWYLHNNPPSCYTIELPIGKKKFYLEFGYTPN